jgi:hypothetical protein
VIGVDDERARNERAAGFLDAVALDFCDAEHQVCGTLRLLRSPNEKRATAVAVVRADETPGLEVVASVSGDVGGWERAQAAGLESTVEKPLERWRFSLDGDGRRVDLEASALSAPLDRSEASGASIANAAGVRGYEQLCAVTGELHVGGVTRAVSCVGRRTHEWGVRDWSRLGRWRSIYAATDEPRGVSVWTALPAGSTGHGDELRAAHELQAPGGEPSAFEEVRVSTVYGAQGLPAKAGLELYRPGEEYPSRVGGEAISSVVLELHSERLALSFFRWSLGGVPASGIYEALSPA